MEIELHRTVIEKTTSVAGAGGPINIGPSFHLGIGGAGLGENTYMFIIPALSFENGANVPATISFLNAVRGNDPDYLLHKEIIDPKEFKQPNHFCFTFHAKASLGWIVPQLSLREGGTMTMTSIAGEPAASFSFIVHR
ncbi:MAG: hypothetical protein AAF092_13700 [Pseudomonadota bacterium]